MKRRREVERVEGGGRERGGKVVEEDGDGGGGVRWLGLTERNQPMQKKENYINIFDIYIYISRKQSLRGRRRGLGRSSVGVQLEVNATPKSKKIQREFRGRRFLYNKYTEYLLLAMILVLRWSLE